MLSKQAIDVWDTRTFPTDLRAHLSENAKLITKYFQEEGTIERDCATRNQKYRESSNPLEKKYLELIEQTKKVIQSQIIRAWHYSRLTDNEVKNIKASGTFIASQETVRARIYAQVTIGALDSKQAEKLISTSLYKSDQADARLGRFWMISHPVDMDNPGIQDFLKNWGGEAIYFWLEDENLRNKIRQIGTPRVLEIAAPVKYLADYRSHSIAELIVRTFGKKPSCTPRQVGTDLDITRPLSSEHILAIHSEGEGDFRAIAQNYPPNFRKT